MNRREIASEISRIENRDPRMVKELKKAFHAESLKRSVCFTGPAGVGKSTLISQLAPIFAEKKKLAWLACDPSSPQSGGSLLGDRIRIQGKNLSDNLFIRSLSTRGTQAFSQAIRDIEIYLEHLFDQVWVETAGSGQTQTEVARLAGITVLILQPETGDDIQWMKSGVREWADLFFVHKADLPGAEAMASSLIESGAAPENVVLVSSNKRSGLEEALEKILRLQSSIDWKKRLKVLHATHARSLFLEREIRKLEKSFAKVSDRLIKNPY